MSTYTIYRGISTNGTIDASNIGTSWSLCKHYANDRAEEMQQIKGHDAAVVIEAKVSADLIDWDMTLGVFAKGDNAFEFEVVLLPYEEIEAKLVYSSDYDTECGSLGSCSTGGARIDETMCALDGDRDEVMARWIEMADQF
jgi:hypothetical protein